MRARARARRERPFQILRPEDKPLISSARDGTWLALRHVMRTDRLRPSPSARASRSSDGLVLLDVDRGELLASNAIGAAIWQLIEEGSTGDEIARRLAVEYDVSLERAERDVDAFVAALTTRRLVSGDPQ
jgi:hypothetical protein